MHSWQCFTNHCGVLLLNPFDGRWAGAYNQTFVRASENSGASCYISVFVTWRVFMALEADPRDNRLLAVLPAEILQR